AEHQPARGAGQLGALVDPVDGADPRLGGGVERARLAVALARALGARAQRGRQRWDWELGHRLGPRQLPDRGPRRVQVLPDAVQRLGRVARREALELLVDRVARAEPELVAPHLGVEAIEGAHRRAAVDLAGEPVDAAVARADEALGGLHEAHRTAEVHAARGD